MKKRFLLIGVVALLAMGFTQAPEINLDDITIKHMMVKSYELGYEQGTKTANAPKDIYKYYKKDNIKDFHRTASDMIMIKKNELSKLKQK